MRFGARVDDLIDDVFELFVVVPAEDDLAAAPSALQADLGAQGDLQTLLGEEIAGKLASDGGWRCGQAQPFGGGFGLAHGEGAVADALPESELLLGAGCAQDGAGVAGADLAGGEAHADLGGEGEQAYGVGDGDATLADPLGDLFLGQGEFLKETLEGVGLFQWGEVFSLNVFDESDGEEIVVGEVRDHDGDGGEFGELGGAPASLAGDQGVGAVGLALDEERLEDAVLADAGGQFLEGRGVHARTGLERVGFDLVDGEREWRGDGGRWGRLAGRDEGIQAAAKGRTGGHAFPPGMASGGGADGAVVGSVDAVMRPACWAAWKASSPASSSPARSW